jgi:hypothetical protein
MSVIQGTGTGTDRNTDADADTNTTRDTQSDAQDHLLPCLTPHEMAVRAKY